MDKKFLVVGCGGLGCSIIENLIRLDVSSITVCDADDFQQSNLNRQLYATPKTINRSKVEVASKRAKELGFKGEFIAIDDFLSPQNAMKMLEGIDIVIDALDNTAARFTLEDACALAKIPLVHGAIGQWNYQVAVVMPGSNCLHKLYGNQEIQNDTRTYSFTPQVCAAVQTAEAIKLAEGIESPLKNSLLYADLLDQTFEIIPL